MSKYLLLIFISLSSVAQKSAWKFTFEKSSHQKTIDNQDRIVVFADASQTIITTQNILSGKAKLPAEPLRIHSGVITYGALLPGNKFAITIDSFAIARQEFKLMPGEKTILGYRCQKAVTVINSNTIELWYTKEIPVQAAPSTIGISLGTVLEMERNGNFAITATKIEKVKSVPDIAVAPFRSAEVSDLLTFREKVWKSRFTTIPVFKDETINFTDSPAPNDLVFRFAKGTVIARKVNFPVIADGSRVFLEVSSRSDGDAYDRTGTIFMIDDASAPNFLDGMKDGAQVLPLYENGNGKKYRGVVKSANFTPALELMRFFTPFGAGKFNSIKIKGRVWQDSAYYRQEVSELAPAFSGREVWIGANISNYDKGGHKLSAKFTIHEEPGSAGAGNFVMPLFNTTSILEVAGQDYATMFNVDKGLEVEFELENDVKNAILRYITTGHGGWERGDEYLKKANSIFLDERLISSFIPWRNDCGTYRNLNPASGNFANGLSSSDYSRSNWCPGMPAIPVDISLGDMPKGRHKIRVSIPQGAPEGTSFSAWNVSGVLIGTKQ